MTSAAGSAGGPRADSEGDLGDRLAASACPVPLDDGGRVLLGHGGGGLLTSELVEHLFLPAFGPPVDDPELTDAAVLPAGEGRPAISTDSYVVRPLFFPGGSIGELAVNGTVNDLAMRGAVPSALAAGFVLEEGLALDRLAEIIRRMGAAAATAGVRIVTGDTKVVERGHGDGMYVTTTGIGWVAPGVDVRPGRARPGDRVILSGPIGQHGTAVLSVREGFEFGVDIVSDTAPLHTLVQVMLAAGGPAVHVLRDPTRGGLATALCELARAGSVGIEVEEAAVPVPGGVAAACDMLGLDPWLVANEGRLVALVAPDATDQVVAAMRDHQAGAGAEVIGTVLAGHPGRVIARTALGAHRVVDRSVGEQLPRIC